MTDLSTEYMGLKLSNPLIIASCSLVKDVENVQRCQDAGAGAVVMKSLFEEQIRLEADRLVDSSNGMWHTEGYDYLSNTQMEFDEKEYLKIVAAAKKQASIPVIASINCATASGWLDYAGKLENSGADALELNISYLPNNTKESGQDVEKQYLAILQEVNSRIKIPIAVKIGPFFSSMARMASELSWKGASALVLFNRFYQFNIDIHQMKISAGNRFSTSGEIAQSLRWIALLAGKLDCDLAASTGSHTSEDVIKHLLAGATVVQLCSTLYLNGLSRIGEILKELEEWMTDNDFNSIPEFHGVLAQKNSEHPEMYERQQYMKALVGIE